ncbi:unnamed protein product [Clonostachys byssicola]|uniref:Secreted protein n=1 Tax=Clonostachys byssicola TaxID=160290 RepID=A0A9N9TZH8_9HYPO|nr:unnamed protein product [Clonostachys byssicola]
MKAHLVLLAAGLTYAAERTQQLPGAVTATTDPTPKVVWGCASELCIATRKERPTRGFAVDCSVPPKNKVPAQGKKKRNFKGKQKRGIRQ